MRLLAVLVAQVEAMTAQGAADGARGGIGSQARGAAEDARQFQPAAIEGTEAFDARLPQGQSASACRRAPAAPSQPDLATGVSRRPLPALRC